jgi:hypothetical protein
MMTVLTEEHLLNLGIVRDKLTVDAASDIYGNRILYHLEDSKIYLGLLRVF